MKKIFKSLLYPLLFSALFSLSCSVPENTVNYFNVDSVFSSFPVKFGLYTSSTHQFIAYYDTAHVMTVASRVLSGTDWTYKKLDSKIGWDSHNNIVIQLDSLGYIHIVGNMHSSPLVYFKSTEPHSINSLAPVNTMIGTEEDITTYPKFITTPSGEIVFHYRYGRSGNGYEVYNKLDVGNQKWYRLLDKPLIDGQGLMNAYMQGPVMGPDGYYHIIWVWRDTPDCSTNHTLSYARSKDLIHWESIRSESVELPITIDYSELYVDTTASGGGLINIGIKLGFDSKNNPLIGYHKYDEDGNTQLFISRYENDQWISKQVTQWDYRWDFKGMGTIENELLIESPQFDAKIQRIIFGYHHIKYGDGHVIVDDESIEPLRIVDFEKPYPAEIDQTISGYPGMIVNKVYDAGPGVAGRKYMLRWETLPPNRDMKREGKLPRPSLLQLVEISKN